jgi:hypothetical protein
MTDAQWSETRETLAGLYDKAKLLGDSRRSDELDAVHDFRAIFSAITETNRTLDAAQFPPEFMKEFPEFVEQVRIAARPPRTGSMLPAFV